MGRTAFAGALLISIGSLRGSWTVNSSPRSITQSLFESLMMLLLLLCIPPEGGYPFKGGIRKGCAQPFKLLKGVEGPRSRW